MDRDNVYARPRKSVSAFAFDESVAAVFPDMIERSVPGYASVLEMTYLLAKQYAREKSLCYDLGCSLGASTLALAAGIGDTDCRIIAVDNAPAMIARCRDQIANAVVPVELHCQDIRETAIERASFIILNYTLQFIAPADRLALLRKIYDGLQPGGVVLVSEKMAFQDVEAQAQMTALHLAFKRANGYSDLEISQKRTALENVLVPDTIEAHQARLAAAGFGTVTTCFQCINFVSLLAYKSS